MSMPAGFKPDLSNIEVGARRRFACRIQLAAFGLLLLGFLAIGLAGARPAIGADPTIAPPVAGQSVYDKGGVLSTHSKATAQALAAHIEAAGGGRVIVYTGADSDNLPDATTLAKSWHVDGLLMVVRGSSGEAAFGATLKGKLTSGQFKTLSGNDSPGMGVRFAREGSDLLLLIVLKDAEIRRAQSGHVPIEDVHPLEVDAGERQAIGSADVFQALNSPATVTALPAPL